MSKPFEDVLSEVGQGSKFCIRLRPGSVPKTTVTQATSDKGILGQAGAGQ